MLCELSWQLSDHSLVQSYYKIGIWQVKSKPKFKLMSSNKVLLENKSPNNNILQAENVSEMHPKH